MAKIAAYIQVACIAWAFLLLTGCDTTSDSSFLAPTAQPAPILQPNPTGTYAVPSLSPTPGPTLTVALLLFGGRDHDVFLGCLNCSKYDLDSVWNRYGSYGSRYSSTSIWNRYGTYGSKYADESPWNQYAQHPPVVVDHEGNFYGYFTENQYFSKRTTIQSLLQVLDDYDTIIEKLDDVMDSMN